MQTLFTILTAITLGAFAKIRGRSFWGWAILAAVAFLIIDTVVALALLALFKDAFDSFQSDAGVIVTFGIQKLLLLAGFVALFHWKVKGDVQSPVAIVPGDVASFRDSKFYVRMTGRSDFTGPFAATEIKSKLEMGEFKTTDVAVEAVGQNSWRLKRMREEEWTPLSKMFETHETAAQNRSSERG